MKRHIAPARAPAGRRPGAHRTAGPSRDRARARPRQPRRVGVRPVAALQPRRPDREVGGDHREDRHDRARRLRDRFVRATADRVAPAGAVDRLGRQRGRAEGHLDRRGDPHRRGLAVSVPRPAGVGQGLHLPRPADLLRRLDRRLVGLGVLGGAGADDRGQGARWAAARRHLAADDHRAGGRRARPGGRRLCAGEPQRRRDGGAAGGAWHDARGADRRRAGGGRLGWR